MHGKSDPSDLDVLAARIADLVLKRLLPQIVDGNPLTNPDRLLCEAEAAEFLALRPSTLASWRCRGGGPPFVRIGAGRKPAIRYRVADLTAWTLKRRFSNTAHQIGADGP